MPRDEAHMMALFYAIKNDDINLAKLLLAYKGTDLSMRDRMDRTPLCLAAKNHKLEMLELLLSHRADPNTATATHLFSTPLNLEAGAVSISF